MRRALAIGVSVILAAAGLAAGYAVGASGTETETVTTVRVKTVKSKPKVVTKTRTVRKTVTVTRTVTVPPTADGLYVDEGAYVGVVEVSGVQWYREEYGGLRVVGQWSYLGSPDCPSGLSYAQLDATLFGADGAILETNLTNETGMVIGPRYPFEMHFNSEPERARIELLVTSASCR